MLVVLGKARLTEKAAGNFTRPSGPSVPACHLPAIPRFALVATAVAIASFYAYTVRGFDVHDLANLPYATEGLTMES